MRKEKKMLKKNIKLKVACIEKGIKIYELADAIGVSDSLMSKVIAGMRNLDEDKKEKIAIKLDKTKEEIFL